MVNISDIRYIAGFFDGEGSIGIYENGRGLFYLRTQLVQNSGRQSEGLMQMMVTRFGGHYSRQGTLSGRLKLNWQLSSTPAFRFLRQIEPFLVLKREQAQLAIAWQVQRPLPSRDMLGRMKPYSVDYGFDAKVSKLLKELKHGDLKLVVRDFPELAVIAVTLLGYPSLEHSGPQSPLADSGQSSAIYLPS